MDQNECSQLYTEIEYREDALQDIFAMQNKLQTMYAEKRGVIKPSEEDLKLSSQESIYHWGSVTAEFYELIDAVRIYLDAKKKHHGDMFKLKNLRKEAEFEFIDMLHFLCNTILFLKVDYNLLPTLSEFYRGTDIEEDINVSTEEELNQLFGILSSTFGKIINETPYKKWKTYSDDCEYTFDIDSINELLQIFVVIAGAVGIDKKTFYSLYVSKNKENYNRQENGY